MPTTPDTRNFEDRYNSCFVDLGVKTIAGLIIGGMLGSFFLRSARKWPLFIGGGIGLGMAYNNCEKSLNEYLLAMEPKVCLINLEAIALKGITDSLATIDSFHPDKSDGD